MQEVALCLAGRTCTGPPPGPGGVLSPALAVDAAALTRRLVAIGLVETQADAEALLV